MQKLFSIILLLFIVLFMFFSCQINPENQQIQESSKGKENLTVLENTTDMTDIVLQSLPNADDIFKTEKKVLRKINNTKSYQNLVTKDDDLDLFIKIFATNPYCTFISERPNIQQIEKVFGIECIRKTNSKTIYSVHKVKQGGLLYIFYWPRQQLKNDYKEVFNWIYSVKRLSYGDFALQEGDSINKIESIDPATSVYRKRMEQYNSETGTPSGGFSMHYLNDGILTIFYEYVNGEYAVSWYDYKNNFQLDTHGYAVTEIYNGRILPIDYIQTII